MDKVTNKGFDTGFDSFVSSDGLRLVELDINLEPLDVVVIEESPIFERSLSELQNEAEALEIQPFEDVELLAMEPLVPYQEMVIDYDAVFDGLDEYDFDGKDYNQNSEQLGNILDGFKEDNWSNLELEGQKKQITGLFDYVTDVLELKNPPNIEYYNETENGNYGGYDSSTNTLRINEYMLHDSHEATDTVAHELWHAYQHECASNPQSPKDFQYQFGFENYIRPSDDFDGYQSQLVEAEARAFADQFKGELTKV